MIQQNPFENPVRENMRVSRNGSPGAARIDKAQTYNGIYNHIRILTITDKDQTH